MANPEFVVVGAGPAGAAAASRLARAGYRVLVAEALPRPGLKPCGRGIPSLGDLPVDLPRDSVVRRIDGADLYVDGEHAVSVRGRLRGVIVDKSVMLEAIIVESGAELATGSFYKPRSRLLRVGGGHVEVRAGLFAGGHGYYDGEKITAVQYRVKHPSFEHMNVLEIWFDTGLVGYYYVFPNRGDEADVGVGGYADAKTLWRLLDRFMKKRGLYNARILRREGARIAVGGLSLGSVDGLAKAGEAAGFVLPLTGEGIRPSMISGAAAADALASGSDPLEAQASTPIARAIEIQRRILERVKAMDRARRARLLREIPAEVHEMVALGNIDRRRLALALARRPRLLARLLSLMS